MGRFKKTWDLEVADYMVQHQDMTMLAIAEHFNVGPMPIRRIRKDLIAAGKLHPAIHDYATPAGKEQNTDPDRVAEIIEKVREQTGNHLTDEESLRILSQIAREAEREGEKKLAIDAVQAFNRVQAKSAQTEIGPKPPLSDQEKTERLAVILEVCGPAIVARAASIAFPPVLLLGLETDIQGVINATQKRVEPEDDLSQHRDGDGRGETTEAGRGNRPQHSAEFEAQAEEVEIGDGYQS